MANREELRPCPFCGGRATIKLITNEYGNDAFIVHCIKCFVKYEAMSEIAVITTWNCRVKDGETK
jgi:hypothetical protein